VYSRRKGAIEDGEQEKPSVQGKRDSLHAELSRLSEIALKIEAEISVMKRDLLNFSCQAKRQTYELRLSEDRARLVTAYCHKTAEFLNL
jgi:hypothetical protein